MDSVETSLQKPLVVTNFTANELRVHQQAILVSRCRSSMGKLCVNILDDRRRCGETCYSCE